MTRAAAVPRERRAAAPAGASYVAVAGRRAAAAGAPEAPYASGGEAMAAQRRLREAGWLAAAHDAPWLAAAVSATVATSLLHPGPPPWTMLWAVCTVAIAAAWLLLRPDPLRHLMPRRLARARIRFAALGITLLLCVALLPWLPLSSAAAASAPLGISVLLMRAVVVYAAACVAAVVFAPLWGPLLLALLLPVAPWAAALGWHPAASQGLAPELIAGTLFSLALAGTLAHRSRVRLRQRATWQAEQERRIAQAEAACADAQRADDHKTRFVTAASHDLRQPVHALGLFAMTLHKRLRGTREEPLVRNIVRSVEGLDRSLNAVMEISRLEAGTVEPNVQHFPLRDLFRRLHMQFAGQAEAAELGLRFSPGGKWLTSDPQLLERILANLIQNAMKYTVRGGIVVVARSTATHFNIEVWDTGVGIAPAELPRIFDEYYQVSGHRKVHLQGLGMGLAIVRRLVRLLGHQLTVASRPGRGTMFRLSIEQRGAPDVQDLTAPADTQPMPAGRARTVLIVEDDEPIRQALTMLLEESGYVALPAGGLDEARQILRVLELPPDLLLSDLHLGDGPDGLSVIGEVRRECAYDIPAILITADTAFDDLDALGRGAHPVLFKPVDPRQLMRCVRELVA